VYSFIEPFIHISSFTSDVLRFLTFFNFCICRITHSRGCWAWNMCGPYARCTGNRRGAYTHPRHQRPLLYVLQSAITWTSTDTSTSSTTPFIILKFKNTAFSEIIMNERKTVDDKRIVCIYIYNNFDSCLYVSLSLY